VPQIANGGDFREETVAADVEAEIFVDDGFRETTDLKVRVEDHHRNAAMRQIVGRRQASRPCAYHDDRALGGRNRHRGRICQMRWLCALVAFAAAIHIPDAAAAQIDPHAALAERAAWEALSTGRSRAAAEGFRTALSADPKNARLHLGAAMAAALERRDADAASECRRALAIEPSLRQARALLGQLLHRMNDLSGAIREYETLAATTAAERDLRDVRATLARWQREAELHGRMQQAIGSHFTVSFEGPEEATLAARALESLDRAYWRIGQTLSVYPVEPIVVVLYTSQQFTDITRSPSWAAGAYDGIVRVPMRGALDRPEELDRVLAHEFAHALIRTLAGSSVPIWLNEGLASALESGDLDWAASRIRSSGAAPLLPAGLARLSADEAAVAYATSAIAARRMLDDAGGVAVANLLRDLGEGLAFDAAFLRRIQRPFADFRASLF
jgi:tetratricopeptide (TPR) repeat protein